FTVALSGGSTPKALFRLLAGEGDGSFRGRVPWNRAQVFWGDERHVPPDHPDSNYRMTYDTLLSRVPVPPENIHRIRTEDPDADKVAESYERTLRSVFRLAEGQLPRFDLVLLGMGPDGHTASLFPGTPALHERKRLVVGQWVEKLQTHRITLTPPVLNNAALVVFLVSGAEKAETLRAVLLGEYQPERFPAQLVRPTGGRLLWLVDRAAARGLQHPGEGND
ncbi:MAG TPA: 6-phosphogluconolactonase, partial [Candidatus Acidoferrum sp.]|nr:6-phosphogluconolactonase [Candidatus Acidoferrum sp.]